MEFRPILLSMKRNKFLSMVIALQVMFTVTVLSLAVSITTQTLSQWNMPSGLDHDNIVSVRTQFFDPTVNLEQAIINDVNRIKQIPGVIDVTPNKEIPFDAGRPSRVYLESGEEAQGHNTNFFDMDENGPKVLGLKLIAGRFYRADEVVRGHSDEAGSPAVVMISEDMAKELFTDESPLGKTLFLTKGGEPAQIIGVYSNFMNGERLNGRGKSYHTVLRPTVTWAHSSNPNYLISVEQGQGPRLFDPIQEALYQIPGRYIFGIERLKRTQKRMYDGRGSQGAILLVVSLVLVFIASFGIAGLVSFLITQRQKQIGIRRALGGTKWSVVRYFLVENSIITLFGLFAGGILTLTLAYMMAQNIGDSFLQFDVVFGCLLFVWLVNIIAVWLPARRAAKVSPAIVTRGA
ncbi:MAG: ABC transporter permease [Psychrobium sp.]